MENYREFEMTTHCGGRSEDDPVYCLGEYEWYFDIRYGDGPVGPFSCESVARANLYHFMHIREVRGE